MSEKKKTKQGAKIVPLQTSEEKHPFPSMNTMPIDRKSSEVFFDVLLQIDQMLKTHFQDSTKENEG